ncbi:MAG: adenosine kinase [Lentisphaeria bacterium]|nr:adenosine kinase [Lentisphaeria bacterium]
MAWKILGAGSPLVDLLLNVDDEFLKNHVSGAKGGMEMVEPEIIPALIAKSGKQAASAPGGSAGNTIFALARMGLECAMLGKLGKDERGEFYKSEFRRNGGSDAYFIESSTAPTGSCLSLVTPDAERTMRSALGASLLLENAEIEKVDFSPFDMVYIEGYMLFSPVFDTLIRRAKSAGCRIGFDLASFEVVGIFKDKLLNEVLPDYVDLLFANEEEAAALLGNLSVEEMAAKLSSICEVAVVKSGVKGSIARRGDEAAVIPAFVVDDPVDTTAAGDLYAAGFIRGLAAGAPLDKCGVLGSRISSEVVKVFGSVLGREAWDKVFEDIKGL